MCENCCTLLAPLVKGGARLMPLVVHTFVRVRARVRVCACVRGGAHARVRVCLNDFKGHQGLDGEIR